MPPEILHSSQAPRRVWWLVCKPQGGGVLGSSTGSSPCLPFWPGLPPQSPSHRIYSWVEVGGKRRLGCPFKAPVTPPLLAMDIFSVLYKVIQRKAQDSANHHCCPLPPNSLPYRNVGTLLTLLFIAYYHSQEQRSGVKWPGEIPALPSTGCVALGKSRILTFPCFFHP